MSELVLIPKAHVVMQPNLQCLFPNEASTEQSALSFNAGASFAVGLIPLKGTASLFETSPSKPRRNAQRAKRKSQKGAEAKQAKTKCQYIQKEAGKAQKRLGEGM